MARDRMGDGAAGCADAQQRLSQQLGGLTLQCKAAGTGTCLAVLSPQCTAGSCEPQDKILEGDLLRAVDDVIVNHLRLDELAAQVLGPPGTRVTLTFISARQKGYSVTFTRQPETLERDPGGVGSVIAQSASQPPSNDKSVPGKGHHGAEKLDQNESGNSSESLGLSSPITFLQGHVQPLSGDGWKVLSPPNQALPVQRLKFSPEGGGTRESKTFGGSPISDAFEPQLGAPSKCDSGQKAPQHLPPPLYSLSSLEKPLLQPQISLPFSNETPAPEVSRARPTPSSKTSTECRKSGEGSIPPHANGWHNRWHSETLTILQKAAEALSKSGDDWGAEEHSSPVSSAIVTAGEDADVLPSSLDHGLTIFCEPNAQRAFTPRGAKSMMKFQGPEPRLNGYDSKLLQMLQEENKRLASSLQSWKEMHDACTVRHAEALRMAEDRVALAEQRVLDYDERWDTLEEENQRLKIVNEKLMAQINAAGSPPHKSVRDLVL